MLYQYNPTAFYQSEASLKPVGCKFNFGVNEPLHIILFNTYNNFVGCIVVPATLYLFWIYNEADKDFYWLNNM